MMETKAQYDNITMTRIINNIESYPYKNFGQKI